MQEIEEDAQMLRAKINQETAKIPWRGLLRFFAQGRVVLVSRELDLVEVAALASADRASALEAWMSEGRIAKVSDQQALLWLESNALLWTVVVKPWVLIQEVDQANDQELH